MYVIITMLVALAPEQYKAHTIMFSDKIKNNILNNGYFHRIYYSSEHFTSNGLYIHFNLKNVKIEKYFNKIKCVFDRYTNARIISFIKNLEVSLLKTLPTQANKIFVHRIEEQLNNNFIKIFSNSDLEYEAKNNIQVLLKISGIWEDAGSYGITFRFFLSRPLEKL